MTGDRDEDRGELLDAMDWLLTRFEGDDSVAYAEVAGVYREKTDAVITDDGPRNVTAFPETGVWCRVFADGAADYRYTTSLNEESLEDVAARAIRGGEFLAQDDPARFDAYTTHRAVHGGWADEPIHSVDAESKVEAVGEALAATDDLALDRVWVNYADEHAEVTLGTTTGSTVKTTLDRASVTFSLTPEEGPKVSRHAGSTRGAAFLDRLPAVFEDAAADVRSLSAAEPTDSPTGETTVALSPEAAGQLFHHASHQLEADARYMGMSPHSVGDRIGPDGLDIEDTVHAGSWDALAFDAEVRPATPVQLVESGEVARLLHNTASAAEDETYPAGNAVPSLGLDQPPRIHARHLEVAPGDATPGELRESADVYVERFGTPRLRDEFERAQREGEMPPSVLYARDVAEKMPEGEDRWCADLPVAEAYRLDGEERAGRVEGVTLDYGPETLRNVARLGAVRATVTGVCEKHKSRLPYAVTAPGLRLRAALREK
ncbi:TldD/PmbA family protein (plasmid) [Halorussus salilacus]|uniref:TldD/PmbA family protein n=1 Tax=Halorussus salilacus TaxID=2953750 RepID=UPI00209FFD68|nr:TldD/PmbA family protein [Halorussus salilacus]USZ69899.1 TldD/PmbA family protein [Halorussus salilacus]